MLCPQPRAEAANPWASEEGPDVQRLALGGDVERVESDGALDINDPFTKAMLDFEPSADFTPTVATHEMLLAMDPSDVFVVEWPTHSSLEPEYYRSMVPEVPVVLCKACNHFFYEEDWELAVMQQQACPFCAAPVGASYGNGSVSVAGKAEAHPKGGASREAPARAASWKAYLDEVTWTTKNWLGLQKQRISVVLHTAIAEQESLRRLIERAGVPLPAQYVHGVPVG
ncbi:hypothetical protein EMIHUDRAFT_219810 [Emiliania huxleyi CCMP1516]|uniref:Uncharacterized protein n=2 Tax=Emiliania huxleyi TaxID=2903 RepID=A0A0D3I3B9_EMIH1|nr:hypothetical protein EMIHUDRAFT_219810 [Emiliania huxleyi CCMP1516]EOD05754.1 hypothetical protein EMIHUDRAFT_219810 [Emiliania huxleyi CCMP1516]|eukprot:XP_005758183.1 hypothetical protein EMIHUDRAFT_219810 [Emiliania huxleyi CCMP1516]